MPNRRENTLLKNDRNEWELPGGRIEINEQPEDTLKREFLEETNLLIELKGINDSSIFEVIQNKHVFLVTYRCELIEEKQFCISDEHIEYTLANVNDIDKLNL